MTARITTLPSGLTIATEYVPSALSVAIGAWVAVGARDEPDEHAGASHFLEHLVFKGTEARTAQDISRSVDRRGAHACLLGHVSIDQRVASACRSSQATTRP